MGYVKGPTDSFDHRTGNVIAVRRPREGGPAGTVTTRTDRETHCSGVAGRSEETFTQSDGAV